MSTTFLYESVAQCSTCGKWLFVVDREAHADGDHRKVVALDSSPTPSNSLLVKIDMDLRMALTWAGTDWGAGAHVLHAVHGAVDAIHERDRIVDEVLRGVRGVGAGREKAPRWTHVRDVFGVGSARAKRMCIAYGVDPDEVVGVEPEEPVLEDGWAARRKG